MSIWWTLLRCDCVEGDVTLELTKQQNPIQIYFFFNLILLLHLFQDFLTISRTVPLLHISGLIVDTKLPVSNFKRAKVQRNTV